MTKQQYEEVCVQYREIQADLEAHTVTEEDRKITAYTQILTDIKGFHKFIEQYEIYNGNVKFTEFKKIIMNRYSRFEGSGNIFECSLFQNSIECMMLFYQMREDEIVGFYSEALDILRSEKFRLLYLKVNDIESTIDTIKRERTDSQGNEMWFPLMLQYLEQSPYGKIHHLKGFDGLVSHLERRCEIELKIIEQIIGKDALVLEAKNYNISEVIEWCK
jgi:hypothetical protein